MSSRPIRRGRQPQPPRRRGRTRWLLVAPVVGLTLIIASMVWLESVAPQVDVSDLAVADVPELALEETTSCTRQMGESFIEDLRASFPAGGRLSSTQVFECPSAFDGLEVTFVGEVVGEVLPRQDGAWAQVNDDIYALEVGPIVGHRELDGFNSGLSVWLPDGLHEQVEEVGRPGRRGDVILIRGVLLQADPDDGGGLTIRAEELETLAASVEIDEPLHVPQLITAIVLALLAVAAIVWSRSSAKRH